MEQPQAFDVYGVGHALVDVQYAVQPEFLQPLGIAKGLMTLIDQAGQERLAAALAQPPLACCSGGSAANTLIGVAALGGRAYLGCQVGTDRWGEFFLRDLAAAGVGCSESSRVPGTTGQCTVLITPDADRTMNTFLGVGSRIGPDRVEEQVVARSGLVYLEGYLATSDNGMDTCREALRQAARRGVKVALTLSDPAVVAAAHARFAELLAAGLYLVFCNEHEAMAYTGCTQPREAGRRLRELAQIVCVTCGANGALLFGDGDEVAVPCRPVRAVDTTGAGDMFAAGVVYGLTHGYALPEAGRLGAGAAAQVVARVGCRLDRSLAGEIDRILHDR
jgi:sugar/nucleoside kinase (ribokinase family)